MTRKVGRFTKYETAELTRMFDEGYSVYKICRNLNRSQKSIRNNLIRLGLVEGIITPIKNVSRAKKVQVEEKLECDENARGAQVAKGQLQEGGGRACESIRVGCG